VYAHTHTHVLLDDRALESQPGCQHELVPTAMCVYLYLYSCAFTESIHGVQEKDVPFTGASRLSNVFFYCLCTRGRLVAKCFSSVNLARPVAIARSRTSNFRVSVCFIFGHVWSLKTRASFTSCRNVPVSSSGAFHPGRSIGQWARSNHQEFLSITHKF
jgi:hypothetical protein